MKISIRGNSKYYQSIFDTERVLYKNYVLEGDFSSNNHHISMMIFPDNDDINRHGYVFTNKIHLDNFVSYIRGKDIDMTQIMLENYFSQSINYLDKPSLQENGMIKSLFMVYELIEYSLSKESLEDISDFIFSSFTIDYSGNLGSQSDIFFIDKDYENEIYSDFINILMDVNLLCQLNIELRESESITSHFIPLIKPGVKRDLFRRGKIDAYPFWKELIYQRNSSIHRFINKK